jgi:tRNA pseudouridine55 synthase
LLGHDKTYRATIRLGVETDTYDADGRVIARHEVSVDRSAIERTSAKFIGPIRQVPPMHSALKKDGKALYDYARAGVEVTREPRRVTISRLDVIEFDSDRLVIGVACTKGTYIRALADDLGQALGCGAHLAALRRTGAGALDVRDAATPATLESMSDADRDACLLPTDCLLSHWPVVRLDADDAGRFLSGLRRRVGGADAAAVRVYGREPDAFLGSAHITGGELIADRLLSPLEVRATIAA